MNPCSAAWAVIFWQPSVPHSVRAATSLAEAAVDSARAERVARTMARRMPWLHPPPGGGSSRARRSRLESDHLAEDLLHDLVGAAPDGPEARVARHALDLVLAHVARSAVQLQAGVHDLEGGALGGQLGHRHLAHGILAGGEAAQRVVGHAAAGVRGGGELDEPVAHGLVTGERAPEGTALAGEGERALQRDV